MGHDAVGHLVEGRLARIDFPLVAAHVAQQVHPLTFAAQIAERDRPSTGAWRVARGGGDSDIRSGLNCVPWSLERLAWNALSNLPGRESLLSWERLSGSFATRGTNKPS